MTGIVVAGLAVLLIYGAVVHILVGLAHAVEAPVFILELARYDGGYEPGHA